MKRTAILLALLVLTGSAAAQTAENQDVKTAIVASTANFPDAMISGAPADKLGIPVLLTERDQLTSSTRTALEETGVNEVVIVGGPAVVSEEVQSTLENEMNLTVTRLWGMTQVGTSVEVSSYFWSEGSEEAVIVQYPLDNENSYRLLSAVKNEVQDEDEPILVSDAGGLSAKVLAEVERLGATDVEVYSTNPVNVTADLQSIGVEEVEVETGDIEALEDRVMNRTRERVRNRTHLNQTFVLVAASSFRHAISAPAVPDSNSYIIGSEEEIEDAVSFLEDSGITDVKVVGNPQLAAEITEQVREELGIEVQQVSGQPEEIAANLARERRQEWAQEQERKLEHWREQVNQAPGMQNAANRTLFRARERINNATNVSEEVQERLREAERLYEDGDYFAAKKHAIRALSERERKSYQSMSREERQERLREERQSLREAQQELREMNSEFRKELRSAESVEERLEVIEDYREKRHEQIREMREEREERREQNETGRKENRTDISAGEAEAELELEDGAVRVKAEYTGRSAGYTSETDVIQQGDTVQFVFRFSSPEGPAAQVITRYREELERHLEAGNYTVTATVLVDGEQVETLTRQVRVSSAEEEQE